MLFLVNLKEKGFAGKGIPTYILLASFLLSGIIGMMTEKGSNNISRYLGLLLLVLAFPMKFKWDKRLFYLVLFSAGAYLVVLQLGQAFGIGLIENYINHFYPIEFNQWGEEATLINNLDEYTQEASHIRYGGIFYNPNIMGQMIVFWYIVMRNFSIETQRLTIAVFAITLISIWFSGSRTAFVVFAIFNSLYYWPVIKRYSFIFLFGVVTFFSILLLGFNSSYDFRIFNITQGITHKEGSGKIKYEIFKTWLEEQTRPANFDWIKFFFGNLSWDVEFDNDPGYVLNFFGFAGALFLLFFLYDIFKNSTQLGKLNFVLLLIGIGATVIMNFRFSILLFVVLSVGYKRAVVLTNS